MMSKINSGDKNNGYKFDSDKMPTLFTFNNNGNSDVFQKWSQVPSKSKYFWTFKLYFHANSLLFFYYFFVDNSFFNFNSETLSSNSDESSGETIKKSECPSSKAIEKQVEESIETHENHSKEKKCEAQEESVENISIKTLFKEFKEMVNEFVKERVEFEKRIMNLENKVLFLEKELSMKSGKDQNERWLHNIFFFDFIIHRNYIWSNFM